MGDSMSTIINATTTNGVVIQPDNSGSLVIQTNSGTTALTIDTSQNVAFAKGFTVGATAAPAFSAYLSSSQSFSAGVATKVQCQTEEFDTNSNYDNATNYRFTPTVAGYYQVNGCWTAASTGTNLSIIIYKNGADFKRGQNIQASAAVVTASALVYMNGSTDYLELYCNSAATQNAFTGANFTYFQASMVRSA
jgi:hypothetical protein